MSPRKCQLKSHKESVTQLVSDSNVDAEIYSVTKMFYKAAFVTCISGSDPSVCLGQGSRALYLVGILLGQDESQSSYLLLSWSDREGWSCAFLCCHSALPHS